MDKNSIKRNVIDSIFRHYEYDGLTRAEADMLFNRHVVEEDFTPREEYKTEYLDEEKLFGQTLSSISKYLSEFEQKFGKGTVEQRWSGYEDNYFVYQYKGVEDDDVIEKRLYEHVSKEVEKYLKEKEKKLAKEKRIKELEKELAELKKVK